MPEHSIAVIGGGASGITAAISAKRAGKSCIILEKGERLGKKILASGNGRCNLLNEKLDDSFYNQSSRPLVKAVFAKFGKPEIIDFFKSLGLFLHSEEGRIFPATNQSASVLSVLERELKKFSVPAEFNFDAVSIIEEDGGFLVSSESGVKISCQKIILTGGGKSYPALGSDGSAYKLAQNFGHSIIEPVPTAVPLTVKDPMLHFVQGQRIEAAVRAIIDGKAACGANGDLLFTKYGLSGAAIMDISEEISVAINRNREKDVEVAVDLAPFMKEAELEKELSQRKARGIEDDNMLTGILPNKFCRVIKTPDARGLKDRRFKVLGTRGWNEAEFTAGGIDVKEVKEESLESKLKKGLYFAGEILDVDGRRGGYNLAWAWASGFVAGLTG
ncbi:MAG: NAD(P)/FAD-dependent oxidoreductase [Candidatus Omnitrophota bacterium]